jgi:hypothetical protein
MLSMTRRLLGACGLSAALLLTACGGGGGGGGGGGPAMVAVPNVTGETQSAATTAISGAGLTTGAITTATSASVTAGSVVSQSPAAGSSVASGSAVSLVVSLGPPVLVPGVVGLTQQAAATAITGAGLALGAVTLQASATVPVGSVISQNPAAGASVGSGSAVALVVSSGASVANALPVLIDGGPAALAAGGQTAANVPYATITLCTPGSATACQVIDHVEVDTGSVGLQILAEVLNGSAVPTRIMDAGSNSPLLECVQFADGYSWGSMVVADVTIGSRHISNLAMHLIGDAAAPAAPSSCVSGPSENTVLQFGANGVLGVGYFLQDCGSFCVTSAPSGLYYACPNNTCTPATVPLAKQAQNPVAQMAADNNGVVIDLPSVAAPGAATVPGTVYFGVATQANNALGAALIYTVDASGYLTTTYNGTSYTKSFIDSGSNGYFFTSSLKPCTTATGFYCPPGPSAQSALIAGQNGHSVTVNFTVDNAEQDFATANLTAFPNLAGTNASANGVSNSFDWGLPLFFGHRVFVVFENATVGGTAGPASAF